MRPRDERPPILDHPVEEESVFTAEALMADVRRLRNVPAGGLPEVCVLEFDGDLTDWLVERGIASRCESWACFHTTMFVLDLDGVRCGIIARTIGGAYAVLIAEQLKAAGVKWIVGLTSAGRVANNLPLPALVVATNAVRDEGTSYHYLSPDAEASCRSEVAAAVARELPGTGMPVVSGKVWTTDAPYRETQTQLERWAREEVLAVEMQAASLFAFGQARDIPVAVVAVVSNAVDHAGEQFDTGSQEQGLKILAAIARASAAII